MTETVLDVAVREPYVHAANTTVGEVRSFLEGGHVHLALIVDDEGTLLAAIDRDDLGDFEGSDDDPAVDIGELAGRTVASDLPLPEFESRVDAEGLRRLAVVDADGHLLGLVCVKRSGNGFCTDRGIAERRADRAV